ncbi:hypothetical protein KKG57_01915, partial [Patescibacteria group bacterium]|nr:hypothetical protein [Patescibacteria group bacterium]
MNKATFFIFLLLLLGIAGGVAWYLVHTSGVTLRQEENVQIIVPELSESKAIYTNGIYGFTVLYPE